MSERTIDHHEGCYIDLMALAGGAESHVFLDIMLTQYSLWAYHHDHPYRLIEPVLRPSSPHNGRARLLIEGVDWQTFAARENGVHRMIRIPPRQSRRHMSFVGIRVSGSPDTPWPEGPEGWGEQIRSLIIDPEPALKNHRTGFVCPDIVGVITGNLEQFWEERT